MEDEDLEDDLYGDLETSIFHSERNPTKTRQELLTQIEELESRLQKALSENEQLTSKLKKTDKNYAVLHKNALSLEATAKAELEKKNFLIAQLNRKIQELTSKIRPQWNSQQGRPEITREDLNECARVIKTACCEAGEVKSDRILEGLSAHLQELRKDKTWVKLKEAQSNSVQGQKLSFSNNMHLHFYEQQCDFKRKEEVIMLPKVSDNQTYDDEMQNQDVDELMACDKEESPPSKTDPAISHMESTLPHFSLNAVNMDNLILPVDQNNELRSQPSTPVPYPGTDEETKSESPELTLASSIELTESEHVSTDMKNHPPQRATYSDDRRRTAYSSHVYDYKRPRSSSKDRSSTLRHSYGEGRYDDRRREHDHGYDFRRDSRNYRPRGRRDESSRGGRGRGGPYYNRYNSTRPSH